MTLLRSYVVLLVCSAISTFGAPDPRSNLQERAPCVFSGNAGAASAIANKTSYSTITLDNVFVLAGTTLDPSSLKAGTKVSERAIPRTKFVSPLCSNGRCALGHF